MIVLLVMPWCTTKAQKQTATTESTVVEMLQQGILMPKGTNLMLYYGRLFLGTPYVAQTLEVNPDEQLLVNLHEMDCSTFVETVAALTLTTRQGYTSYDKFCQNLQLLRYHDGIINGYDSRNHYFQWWIENAEHLGLAREIKGSTTLWSASQTLDLRYMSEHPKSYPMMADDLSMQAKIREHERASKGKKITYIPKALVGKSSRELPSIESGDILAIVTKKNGLDTSHLGIAVWGSDGRLHLLNASSLHKKVVVEPLTLFHYMQKHPTQIGIRVVRI